MDIKLIALDMDGTALKNNGQLSERTATALTRTMDKGIVFVPTTGRLKSNLPKVLLALPGWKYAITSNGAAVWDIVEDKVIASRYLDKDIAAEILERLDPLDMFYEIYSGGTAYIEKSRLERLHSLGLSEAHIRSVEKENRPITSVENVTEFLRTHPVEKIFFPDTQKEKHEKAYEILKEYPVLVSSSAANNLEINDPGAHKGNGLQGICDYLGLKPEQVMAAGDNLNDFEMLRFSGFAVAMGNAIPQIKEMADYITLSNEEDGVAVAIEKFVLEDK